MEQPGTRGKAKGEDYNAAKVLVRMSDNEKTRKVEVWNVGKKGVYPSQ